MRVQNGDISLELEVDGDEEAPPLLLMHGILGCARTWDWLVPRVVDRFRVLRLEFRGHGASDRAPGQYGLPGYLSDAVVACEQAAGAPCAVIGHSLGGATAAALAQQHPALVRGALLEDAPLAVPDPAATGAERNSLLDAFAQMRVAIPRLQEAGLTVDQSVPMVAMSPYAGGGTLGDLLLADGLASMAAGMLQVDASVLDVVLEGRMDAIVDLDRGFEVPIVAVAADPAKPDAVTRPADLDRLRAATPAAVARTLAGANHLIHDTTDQREAFWSEVSAFLDALA